MSPSHREIHFQCPNCNHSVTCQVDGSKPLQACTRCGQLVRVADIEANEKPVKEKPVKEKPVKHKSTSQTSESVPNRQGNPSSRLSTSFDDLDLDYLDKGDVVASSTMPSRSTRPAGGTDSRRSAAPSRTRNNESAGKQDSGQTPKSARASEKGNEPKKQTKNRERAEQLRPGSPSPEKADIPRGGAKIKTNSDATSEPADANVSLAAPIPPPFVPTPPPAPIPPPFAPPAPYFNAADDPYSVPLTVDPYEIPKSPPRPKTPQPPTYDAPVPGVAIELSLDDEVPGDVTLNAGDPEPGIYYPDQGSHYPNRYPTQAADPNHSGYQMQPPLHGGDHEQYRGNYQAEYQDSQRYPMPEGGNDETIHVPGLEVLDDDMLGLAESVNESGIETSQRPDRIVTITCRICDTRQYREASASENFKCEVCFAPMKMSSRHMPVPKESEGIPQQRSRAKVGDLGRMDDRSSEYMTSEPAVGGDEVDDLIRTVAADQSFSTVSGNKSKVPQEDQLDWVDKVGSHGNRPAVIPGTDQQDSGEYNQATESELKVENTERSSTALAKRSSLGNSTQEIESVEQDSEDELRLQPVDEPAVTQVQDSQGLPDAEVLDDLLEIVDEEDELEVIDRLEIQTSQSQGASSPGDQVKMARSDSLFLDGDDIASRPESLPPFQQRYADYLKPLRSSVPPVVRNDVPLATGVSPQSSGEDIRRYEAIPVTVDPQSGMPAYNAAGPHPSHSPSGSACVPAAVLSPLGPPPFHDPNKPRFVSDARVDPQNAEAELTVFERPFINDWVSPFRSGLFVSSLVCLVFGVAVAAASWAFALDSEASMVFRVGVGIVALFVTLGLLPVLFWFLGTVATKSYQRHAAFDLDSKELPFFLFQYSILPVLGMAGAILSIPFANVIVTGLFAGLAIFLPGLLLLTNATYRRTLVCFSDSAVNRSFSTGVDEWYKSFGTVGSFVTFGLFIGMGCSYLGTAGAIIFLIYTLVAFYAFAIQVGRLAEVVWTLESQRQSKV